MIPAVVAVLVAQLVMAVVLQLMLEAEELIKEDLWSKAKYRNR